MSVFEHFYAFRPFTFVVFAENFATSKLNEEREICKQIPIQIRYQTINNLAVFILKHSAQFNNKFAKTTGAKSENFRNFVKFSVVSFLIYFVCSIK